MFEKYFDKYIVSSDMKEYLKKTELIMRNISDIIYFSVMPINEKLTDLRKVLEIAEGQKDDSLKEDCREYIKNIEVAFEMTKKDGIFTVDFGFYNEERNKVDSSLEKIFDSFDGAIKYIREDIQKCEYTDEDRIWYEVTRYQNNGSGEFEETSFYIVIRGEIYFTEVKNIEGYDISISLYNGTNLNLPVPFKAGDVVEIDGFPFGPKYQIMIMDVGDNRDCCCLQGLYLDDEDGWFVGAVKHGMLGHDDYFAQISPLYTAAKVDKTKEKVFEFMRENVHGDENVYSRLWLEISCRQGGMTDEDIMELIKKLEL